MSTKENPTANGCYEKALPNEQMFILLARDPDAPSVVRFWTELRLRRIREGSAPIGDTIIATEALGCATLMEEWRNDNMGTWRKSK